MKKKRQHKSQGFALALLYMLLGAAGGVMMVRFTEDFPQKDLPAPQRILLFGLLVVLLYAAILLQILIHESGHLVFGLLTGYRFSSFRIFNWMWVKQPEGGIRLKHLSLAGTGGQCLMTPPDLIGGQIPVLLYNLGGVLFNLLTSLLFFGLSLLLPGPPLLLIFLRLLALTGLALGIVNGLPLHLGPADNDGCNVLSLLRSRAAVRAFWVQMKVNESTSRGIRPRDMPEEWFALPEDEDTGSSLTASLGVFAAGRLMDEHRFAEAEACMKRLFSSGGSIPGLYLALMTCDRIYIELITQNRPEVIQGFLSKDQKKLMKAMKNYPSVLRTQYALALFSGNREEAEKTRLLFEKVSASYPYPCEIEGERELMELAGQAVEEKR